MSAQTQSRHGRGPGIENLKSKADLKRWLRQQLDDPAIIRDVKRNLAPARAVGAFSVYRSAALNVATGDVIAFDVEDTDVSEWDASGVYTPQKPGLYRLSAGLTKNAGLSATTKFWFTTIRKNGVAIAFGNTIMGTAGTPVSTVARQVFAGGSDSFDVTITHNETGSVALATGRAACWFDGEYIGQA